MRRLYLAAPGPDSVDAPPEALQDPPGVHNVVGLGDGYSVRVEHDESVAGHEREGGPRGVERRALDLGARTLALPLPDPHAGDLDLSDRIDALVAGAMAAIAELAADLTLLLVPPPAEVARARQAVAELASKPHPPSVALRLEGVDRTSELPRPHGASRRESPTGRSQLVK